MSGARISPNKDVCAEAAILTRLGFQHIGPTGSGHLLFVHAAHGEIVVAGSPRDWNWRRSHRRQVARAMGLTSFQLERLIAGQRLDGQPRRKPSKRPGRQRNRAPRALRHLTEVPAEQPTATPATPPADEPAPVRVRVFAPSDPISPERRAQWRRQAAELERLNAEARVRGLLPDRRAA